MRRIAIIIFSFSVLVFLDFISKWFFSGYFQSKVFDCFPLINDCLYRNFPIFGEYLGFQLSHNTGIAFSLPLTGLPLQIITLVLVSILVYSYIRYEYYKKQLLIDIGYVAILAGAISHAYERVFVGHVIDFISVKYFAILNFADIFISTGAFLIIVYYVFLENGRRN